MFADQLIALGSERRKELIGEADRRRQVQALRRTMPGFRHRVGRRIVGVGVAVSGECVDTLLRSNFVERRTA